MFRKPRTDGIGKLRLRFVQTKSPQPPASPHHCIPEVRSNRSPSRTAVGKADALDAP